MIRLQKYLSDIGYASRRKCEKIILDRKVKINGRSAQIGDKVGPGDNIQIDDKIFTFNEDILAKKVKILAYHKRTGEIVSRQTPTVSNTVFDYLPNEEYRWINIGRLDVATSGLLLFSNDGHTANKLMHPSSNIQRVYLVRLDRKFSNNDQNICLAGIDIGRNESGKLLSIKSRPVEKFLYEISLKTGKNREVRRIFKKVNYNVHALTRIAYGSYKLGNIKQGDYKYLSSDEIRLLLD